MYNLRMLTKKRIPLFVAGIISFFYALAGGIVSVIRYWQYEIFYYDFGIFDKVIWQVSQFSTPIMHHMVFDEKIVFADHFSPSIFLLSPLFWIAPFSETLLIAQAAMVAVSGFILFLIAKIILKNNFYAISLLLLYFLFVGLQNAVITDFHEITIAVLLFMLTFFSIVKQKVKLYFVFLILFLGCKETMFLQGIGIGLIIFFLQPPWKKIALSTILLSLLWGVVSIKLIIPFFSGGTYLYASQLPTSIGSIIASFFNTPIKQQTLFYTFSSFGFLPLLSPAFWFLIFQDFLIRFYPEFPTRWGLGFHYSALIAAIMAVSSLYSLNFLQHIIKKKVLNILVIFMVLYAAFLYRVVLDGPFALAYNPAFYTHTKDFKFLYDVIKLVPKDASIMTQNNLAPHFTHQKVWLLISDRKAYNVEYYTIKKPDYILIDNRPGQNPNNFFGIKDMTVLLNNLRKDMDYKLVYNKNGQLLFKRVSLK